MYNSGVRGRRGADGYGVISGRDQFIQTKLSYPSITGYNACNVSQVILDDTAVTPGGYMLLYGTAFTTGMTLTIGTATVSSYTLVNTGRIFLTVPITLITGTYNVSIFSSTGGGAIFTTLLVSGFPTFTQISYTVTGTTVVNVQLLVSGDAPLTYSLGSASTLPPGVSLSGTGLLSGTISPFSGNAQTYSFNINVDDAQSQTTTQLITLSVQLGDTYWPNNTLLLDSNTPGNVNTFVTDASLNNNIATIFGDTRPSNLNPYQAGYYSNYFDGTGDYLSIANSTAFDLPGDFTIQFWLNLNVTTSQNIIAKWWTGSNQWVLQFRQAGQDSIANQHWRFYANNGTTAATDFTEASTTSVTTGIWNHIALTRSGSSYKFFRNGIQIGSTYTNAAAITPTTDPLTIGQFVNSSTEYLTGYMSNLQIVKGVAVYTAAFTPSTSPLTATQSANVNGNPSAAITGSSTSLLTCQSNRLIDNSINNFAITKNGDTKVTSFIPFLIPTSSTVNTLYSTYFDGTGDSIRISPDNAVFQMGTGDFTIEAWVNPTALSATDARIWSYQDTGGSAINLSLLATGSASVFSSYIRSNGATGANQTNGTTTAVVGTWYHVAFSRYSGTTKLFVNGIQEGSTGTTQTQNVTAGAAAIGYYPTTPGEYITGYVSNIRIVKGVGVYTGNFTVPTSNLTATQSSGTNIAAITGLQTSLLTCQNSTIIDNSNNALTSSISSNGDARPLAVSPFTQTTTSVSLSNLGSSYFDGTTDGLYLPPSLNWALDQSITMEGWVYFNSGAVLTSGSLLSTYDYYSLTEFGWGLGLSASSKLNFTCFGNGGSYGGNHNAINITGATTIVTGQWYHFAFVKNGTSGKIYLNGISDASGTFTETNSESRSLGIGMSFTGNGTRTGYIPSSYIEDVRFVKGTALYTSNFAPPAAPLTAVTNTGLLTCKTSQPTNNSMFVDNSSLSSIVTRTGNVSQGSFNPYGLNWSNYFDGTGDYIRKSGAGVLATSGDVTIECWIYPASTSVIGIFDGGQGESAILRNYPANVICRQSNEGTGATFTVTALVWQHFACTFSTGNIKVFINGSLNSTGTYSPTTYNAGVTFDIGSINAPGGGFWFNGYISNFRVTQSILYTTTFSPSTSPLTPLANTTLLTCQSASFVDNSGSNFTLTRNGDTSVQRFNPFSSTIQSPLSYSMYFNGTTDYFTTPNNAVLNLSSGDFTIEMWVFWTGAIAFSTFIDKDGVIGTSYPSYNIGMASGSRLRFTVGNGSSAIGYFQDLIATTATLPLNTWTHVAGVKSGTTLTLYQGGINVVSATQSGTIIDGGKPLALGGNGATYYVSGEVSNLRIVKGQALYTSNFTPTSVPLTTTSQGITTGTVSLLTFQSSISIDNSSNALVLTAGGTPRPLTFNPFGYTTTQGQAYTPALFGGSGYFDGSGDYLTIPSFFTNVGTNSFTMEFWAYPIALPSGSNCMMLYSGNGGGVVSKIYIQLTTTGTLAATATINGGANNITTTATVTAGQWQHIALVRNVTAMTLYLNGANVGTTTNSVNVTGITGALQIGYYNDGATSSFNGYITDFRITYATAVYTSNFVPPITPLTATTGTVLFLNMTKAGIPDYTRSIDLETVGDARITTESAYNGNYYSNYFNVAVGDQLSVPNNSVFDFVANNFTMEGWVYQISSAGVDQPIIAKYSANPSSFIIETVNGYWFATIYYGGGASALQIANGSTAIVLGTWNHWACTRNGANFYFYVNGVQIGTAAAQTINTSTWAVVIGGADGRNMYWPGYISNIRVVNGQALVTGTFTPSTTPLTATTVGHTGAGAAASITGTVALLTCQSNKLVDNSSNNFTLTRIGAPLVKSLNPFTLNTPTSMSFDGTGDYLVNYTTPQTAAFGTGDFTIEMWVYVNTLATLQVFIDCRPATTNGAYLTLYITTSGTIIWQTSATSQITSSAIVTGAWYYVAVSRSGANTRMFINGNQSGSTYTDSTNYVVSRIVIGANSYTLGIDPLNGYIEDLRITKGIARYAGNFTVPTNKLPTF